jgi:ABC-type nickel/cobalt efflux system permease component RcnA
MNSLVAAILLLLQITEARESGLSAFSWSFMIISMGAVTLLAAWCFSRILRGKRHFDPDGTGPAHSPVTGKVDREGGV